MLEPSLELGASLPQHPARRQRLAAARERFAPALVERFERGMYQTDERADRVVEAFGALPPGQGWQLLERALRARDPELPGAPPALAELLTPLFTPPSWLESSRLAAGAAIWWRFAPVNLIALSGALLVGYQHGDLVKPQAFNGRTLAMAGRRYEETARWAFAASEPGALLPGGNGFDETVRIRLVHAVVRKKLRARPDWDRTAWGEPIHSTGMCLTNLALLLLPIRMGELLGMRYTFEELESLRQLWCWVGHLFGLPEDLLPSSISWALKFAQASHVILAPPDHDSAALIDSALRGGIRAERMLPERWWPLAAPLLRPLASRLVYGTSAAIIEGLNETAEATPARSQLAVRLLRPLVGLREWSRYRGLLGSDLAIATRQRAGYARSLARIRAAEQSMRPEQAEQPAPAGAL